MKWIMSKEHACTQAALRRAQLEATTMALYQVPALRKAKQVLGHLNLPAAHPHKDSSS